MNYAIPGFQTPGHPYLDTRVYSHDDGTIDFLFLDNRPLDEKMPPFVVYISVERGRETNLQALTNTTKFIYEKHCPERNQKSYWFRLRTDDLTVLPGTYQVRFMVNGDTWVHKSLTVRNSPALKRNPTPGDGTAPLIEMTPGDPEIRKL